jgi:hypothetical protein
MPTNKWCGGISVWRLQDTTFLNRMNRLEGTSGHDRSLTQENPRMDVDRIRHVLNSLMILSFLIFGGLAAIILIADVELTSPAVALPFAFLFISLTTLITTGQINDRPRLVKKYLRDWLIICAFAILVSALVITFA